MFWTAFVWGLGVTFGGSIGLMTFVMLFHAWQSVMHSEKVKRANELAEAANVALTRRNELTEKQIEHLESIAIAADVWREMEFRKDNESSGISG